MALGLKKTYSDIVNSQKFSTRTEGCRESSECALLT